MLTGVYVRVSEQNYYRMHFICYFSISIILLLCLLKVSLSLTVSRLNDEERFKRRKRESVLDYYIDITAYVDYTVYSRFLNQAFPDQSLALNNIKDYFAFIINGVDTIYRDSVTNYHLHVRLSKIVVFKDPELFPLTYISTSSNKLEPLEVLTNFTEFLLRNDSTKGTTPYDFAILFIEADLWINDTEVKGISYVGTLCSDDGTSSSVVEDMGDYYSIYTTARILAISMSAKMDGDNNNCSSDDFYLMSSHLSNITDSSIVNPWRLSNCTIDSFMMFISSLENTSSSRHACLLNTSVTHVSDVSPRLLGQEIYPDKQCQLKYGQKSYDCQRQNVTSSICTKVFCYDPNRSTCFRQLPLHGTTCGCGKICKQGACLDDQIFENIECGVTNTWSNCTLASCLNKISSDSCQHTCITYLTYLAYLTKPPRVVNFTVNGDKSVYLRENGSADFFCQVDGIPTPTAYLNGSFLSKIHDLTNSSNVVSYRVTNVSCNDSGRYFCYGRNGHENVSSFEADYVDINVTCKPRLLPSEAKYENESKEVRISVDSNTKFTVIIYGYPEPTQYILKVEKDNVFTDLSVHHEVTYTKLTPPFGQVSVTIYDAHTRETKTYNLNIKNEAGTVDVKFNVIKEETVGPTSGGDDVGTKVGIGVGVGLGVLLLATAIIVTVCIVRRRRLKKTPTQPPQYFNPAFDKPEFHKKRQVNLETDYIN